MYIDDVYQQFIHLSRYARWRDDLGRRESWTETVDRYVDYMADTVERNNGYEVTDVLKDDLRNVIVNREVLPSMRALMTAGPALERENVAGYNCAFLAVDDPRAFDEALYILMNGTGVGYSVEHEDVSKLPEVPDITHAGSNFMVPDSKRGWAEALDDVISQLYKGMLPSWDTSQVREAGARLKTFGGRASGPGPLNDLLDFVVNTFMGAQGRKLTPLEAHEIMCKIGEVVVVGGVRRSALICLTDLSDVEMRDAKKGEFWEEKPHLTLANISAVYDKKPSRYDFDKEFDALIASQSGERGIFSRYGAKASAEAIGRDPVPLKGTNPCGEIVLRSGQFCNLTTVVIRPEDTLDDLKEKVSRAAYLGTFQATLTRFDYLRPIWKENTEEERLLGISLSGLFGHPVLSGRRGKEMLEEWLYEMRVVARFANIYLAQQLGINPAAAITCIKPEGTTSQLVGVSSGMHAWFDKLYKRNVRGDIKDPLSEFLVSIGVPYEVDITNDSNYVFSFPVKAPENAMTRDDLTAVEHLELWTTYKECWTDHNPSVTINVRKDEWDEVREWVWNNFDKITGVSFLPYDDHVYKQAPYEPTTEEDFAELEASMPEHIDWTDLSMFEFSDNTSGSQEMACSSGSCEIIQI